MEASRSKSLFHLLCMISSINSSCKLLQAVPVFTFANQAGLDMLETTLVALQDISLEKIFDDHGRKNLCSEIPQIMHQVSHFDHISIESFSVGKTSSFEIIWFDLIICLCWKNRVLHRFKAEFVCRAWAGPSRTREPWRGKSWTKTKIRTASASCSSTGLSFDAC